MENAIRLLKLFSIDHPVWSVTEIANELEVAKSTAHRILISLESEGLTMKDPMSTLYRLGVSFLSLGNVITKNMRMYNYSSKILKHLQKATGELLVNSYYGPCFL